MKLHPRTRPALTILAACALAGCFQLHVEYQNPPPAAAFGQIKRGETTRSEVLAKLGPPEEVRLPGPGEGGRRADPRVHRLLRGGDVFGNRDWTWSTEHLHVRAWGIFPVGPAVFRVRTGRTTERRWRIEFDEVDVVRELAVTDGIGDE